MRDEYKSKEQLIEELQELRRRVSAVQTSEAREAWGRAEAALIEADERYRELFEAAPDIIYTHDLEGRFTAVNHAFERITGYSRDEAMRMNVTELVVPEHVAPLRAAVIGEPGLHGRRCAVDFSTKDGRRVPLEVSIHLLSQRGETVAIQAIARDITDRQLAAKAGQLQSDQQQLFFDALPAFVICLDEEGRLVRANRTAAGLLGMPIESVIGKTASEMGDRAAFLGLEEEVIRTGQPKLGTLRQIPAATGNRWIQFDTVPLRDESANIRGAVVFGTDITERIRSEQASKDTEEQFRALFELAPVGIARIDAAGKLIDANRALQEMAGYTIEELRGRSITDFSPPEDVTALTADCRDLFSGKRERYEAERRYYRKDGSLVWADVTASVVRDALGAPLYAIAMVENVSERRLAEEALRQTNERLTGWVTELEQRTREIGLLSEMGDLLQACRSADEAYAVIGRMARQLFPTGSGSVCVIAEQSNLLEVVVTWGSPVGERLFAPDECWALRRGRVHLVQDFQVGLVCRHMQRPVTSSYMCLPMMAQGEILGLLNLSLPEPGRLSEPKQRLAMTVAEHISLALANLKLQETLRSQSIRDPLTTLFNRRYMEESLDREMRRAVRGSHPVSIIMLDLDYFKRFNDLFGHEAGDMLLREVGNVLQRSIRGGDIACRYGGEEFTLILPQVSLLDAAQRAEQIRDAIKRLNLEHRRTPLGPVTVSLGVAVFPDHGPNGEAVLRAADAALYQAKTRGRDRVAINPGGPGSMVDLGQQG